MNQSDGPDWTPLHDLALLYLALVHGADAEIGPGEMDAMGQKLMDWSPESSERAIQRVREQVMLMYVSESGRQMLEASVASLSENLKKGQRIAVLNDLAELASADGTLAPGEVSFIQELALQWGVDGG